MASEAVPHEARDAAWTHTVGGFFGEKLTIAAYPPEDPEDGGAVLLIISEPGKHYKGSIMISGPSGRDEFARAWMEACRRADGEPPATEARDDAPTREEVDRCGYSEDPYHRCRVCYDYAAGRERDHPLTAGEAREHG